MEAEVPSLPPMSSICTSWWSKDTVAIVTGSNKGIGFALVKQLAELGLTVILTARDKEKGLEALQTLRAQGLKDLVNFLPLDISDPTSINTFVSMFQTRYGFVDILVNNAAVSFNEIDDSNSVEHAETVIKTNFYGTRMLTEALLPLFRRSSQSTISRIVNVSSRLGSLDKVRNSKIKQLLESETLSEETIEGLVCMFLESVKNGTWKSQGWPVYWTDYAVSKLALNAYSRVLAKRYDGVGLSVNCFCPGYTQTAMTKGKGTHTADEAADFGARLALLPPPYLCTGKFFLFKSSSCLFAAASKL